MLNLPRSLRGSIPSELNSGGSSFALVVNFAANVVPIVVNSHMLSKAKRDVAN